MVFEDIYLKLSLKILQKYMARNVLYLGCRLEISIIFVMVLLKV
jgi:hypothetical protein